jgi:hypothetical protein
MPTSDAALVKKSIATRSDSSDGTLQKRRIAESAASTISESEARLTMAQAQLAAAQAQRSEINDRLRRAEATTIQCQAVYNLIQRFITVSTDLRNAVTTASGHLTLTRFECEDIVNTVVAALDQKTVDERSVAREDALRRLDTAASRRDKLEEDIRNAEGVRNTAEDVWNAESRLEKLADEVEHAKRRVDLMDLLDKVLMMCELAPGKTTPISYTAKHRGQLTFADSHFCGADRVEVVNEICQAILLQPATESLGRVALKESQFIFAIVGAPRMGKSRVLHEIARKINETPFTPGTYAFVAIPISFNNTMQLKAGKWIKSSAEFCFEVFCRVIASICELYSVTFVSRCRNVLSKAISGVLTWDDIVDLLVNIVNKSIGPGEAPFKRVVPVLVADEFSKLIEAIDTTDDVMMTRKKEFVSAITTPLYSTPVCGVLVASGFTQYFHQVMDSTSGRPTKSYFLGPIVATQVTLGLHSYAELRFEAERHCSPAIFHGIRFLTGLMGLVVEMHSELSEKGRPNERIICLDPPVLKSVRPFWQKFSRIYWAYVANHPHAPRALSPELYDMESRGALIHFARASSLSDSRSRECVNVVLNPYFVVECVLDDPQWFWRPMKTARGRWLGAENDDCRAHKGKFLVALLTAGIALRAMYTIEGSVGIEQLILTLAGECVLGAPLFEDELVTLSSAQRSIVSFPCHSESDDAGTYRSAAIKTRHFEAASTAVQSLGILIPSAKYNKGCDLALVGGLETMRGLILFECRYWELETNGAFTHVSLKACMCLLGLLARYKGVFKRVAFVYLTTHKIDADDLVGTHDLKSMWEEIATVNSQLLRENEKLHLNVRGAFGLKSILAAAEILDPGMIFTVHQVCCPVGTDPSPQFNACFMESLSFLCPSFELW